MTKWVHGATRNIAFAVIIVLLAYTLLIIAGRLLLPHIDDYRQQIEDFVSKQTGVAIRSERIGGTWTGLTPRLWVQGLTIGRTATDDEAPPLAIEGASGEIDLAASLRAADIVWQNLTISTARINLQETADGRWHVSGMPAPQTGDRRKLQQLFNFNALLGSRFIGIDDVRATLHFYSGATAAARFSNIKLEGSGDFHRLTAGLALDDNPAQAQLIVESTGNAATMKNMKARGYLRLNRINFSGSLRALVASWFPTLAARIGNIESELATELWFESNKSGHVAMRGRLKADEFPLNWAADVEPMRQLNATLSGWFNPGETWGIRWRDLRFNWSDVDIEPLTVSFGQRLGARWHEMALEVDHVNLATLSNMLLSTKLVEGKSKEVVAAMQPSGSVNNLRLYLDVTRAFPLVSVSADLERIGVASWRNAPAAKNLSGRLYWQDTAGYFDLDSPNGFAMHYPGVYEDFMPYSNSRGRVHLEWKPRKHVFKIAGGPIQIDGEEGSIRAFLSLDLPTEKGRAAEMWLQAGIRNSHSRYLARYLPKTLRPSLRHWLDQAIGEMDIVEGGFVWRGPLVGQGKRSIQVFANVDNATVDYDPGWPAITDMSARVTVNNGRLGGVISRGKVAGARVQQATVSTETHHSSNTLAIDGDMVTGLDTAASILLKSPIADRVAMLQDWRLHGKAKVNLRLGIPLTKGPTRVAVRAQVRGGQMAHRSMGTGAAPLVFENIEGTIGYSDRRGLHSTGIQADLWQQHITGQIATTEGETHISAQGQVVTEKLPFLTPALRARLSGQATYQGIFRVPVKRPPELEITSSMEGIGSNFPAPLNKAPTETLPLKVRLVFTDDLAIHSALGDAINALFRVSDFKLVSGAIALNTPLQADSAGKGFTLTGNVPTLDIDAWRAVYEPMQSGNEFELANLEPQFALDIGALAFQAMEFPAIKTHGSYGKEGLKAFVANQNLAGNIQVPATADQPISLHLDFLALPKPEREDGRHPLDDLDPASLPYLDFSTEGLRIGAREFGSLGFLLKPRDHGVDITQFRGQVTGIKIHNLPDEAPATLSWDFRDGTHRSQITGLLSTKDLGAVLRSWSLPVVIDSEEAVSIVELGWPDKPWNYALNSLKGHATLNLKEGNFFRAPNTPTNAFIKVIGLVNFDTWLRRLKLDFSDLFSSGVNYDSLKGGLLFDEGIVSFEEPIVAELPSGKVQLLGQTDMNQETIDARLVATLPVGTNLPWVAALVGGLPAAAGVYLTGRLFEREVDRISSLSYRVTGSLDEPRVEVDRIFSDKTDG